MTTGSGEDVLRAAAHELQLEISQVQIDQLLGYVGLLQKWNGTYNLTAIRDFDGILSLHLLDCLAAVAPLRRVHLQKPVRRLLDVGSGGGLPGVIFAIVQPDIQVTCVDAVGKKAAFVQQVHATLGLRNLQSVHSRVESLANPVPYDLVTSRAFSSLGDFVRLTRRLIAPDGLWMALKGKEPSAEQDQLPPDVQLFHVEPIQVPGLKADRHLAWMRPLD